MGVPGDTGTDCGAVNKRGTNVRTDNSTAGILRKVQITWWGL